MSRVGHIALLFIIIVVVASVILYFIFRPKAPQVVATPVDLQHIDFALSPSFKLNMTVGLSLTIFNGNPAGFKYDNSTTILHYRGFVVGQVPIEAGTIPASSTQNISTSVEITVTRMLLSRNFWPDVTAGALNFTSSTGMHGKVNILSAFMLKAAIYTTCVTTVFLQTRTSISSCNIEVEV